FVALGCCALFSPDARAQRRRTSTPRDTTAATTTANIPSPRSVLGFTPGDERTIADWQQILGYFARLDAASERVRVETVGETTLGRPIVVAIISAPENIRDLRKYKEIQRRLADPRTVADGLESANLIDAGKTVVAISCSIHSTEVVASQMSMQLAYELASANDAETRAILSNTILLLIPSANPDGNDIVARWYRRTLGTPYEGTEPPELYHHYAGHDNNRDWFMLNLKESQALTRLFWKEWFPQIVYDVHQQGQTGSRFFIPPFYDPPNPHIAPLLLREVGLVGHKIAADLESAGQAGVITNAMYDTWWHGGFRTAPYYHNSIGILSEAASARLMTPINVTPEQLANATARGMPAGALQSATNFPTPWAGGLWRPRDIMRMELIASRSVLSLAANYRARYLRNFYELGRRALDWQPTKGQPVAYLIPAGQGHDERVARMLGALIAQGVEVHRLERELHGTLQDATLHTADQTVNPVRGGEREERRRQQVDFGRGGKGSFLPPAQPQEIPAGSYLIFLAQPFRANVQSLFERQVYPDRRTAGGEAERPYDVAGWTLPLQMGVETAAVNSIVEPANQRRLTLLRDENEIRTDLGLRSEAVVPQRLDARGQFVAPASPIPNPIKRPVRLALYKSYAASMDEGWTRYVFDTFNLPFHSATDADIRAKNLRARFDVIILPSMRARDIIEGRADDSAPPEFTQGIGAEGVANLRRFVEEGGTLICFDAATEFAIKQFELPVRNVLADLKSSEFYCPGSILQLDVDNTHPLARGFSRDTDAYFVNSAAFEVTDNARARIVARYAERGVLRSGWLLGERHIAGRAALVEATLGRGRVVLFGFRPQHRAQTWGTFPFIFNAIERGGE
ncbi:MAG TPA: M14 family zinc carboxypeptidase, partial [Pyrinomonadaceae bacterium]|nr:M14 family zinc carboxypeptidase [Pyrinomonadaceae bacterium]